MHYVAHGLQEASTSKGCFLVLVKVMKFFLPKRNSFYCFNLMSTF